ncbi:MAG: molybdopterin-guanine dinucleotide biosynthesis protein B [archaeon]|nr:molybdopterin-guanine dinucleotide biosynthesis protein B [archaeon]MCP8306043.1 molybdopterin-guanine dinucleotide biosynthesis protein B [archaeon]
MAKVVAVIGSKDSGKTSTIEYLISNLSKEGFNIASVKHVHEPDFTIDVEGKDTWRYARAGAKVIVIVASKEVVIIKKGVPQIKLEEILKNFEDEGIDIIFIEGLRSITAKRRDIYKIVTAKDEEDLERIMKGITPPILAITGMVARLKPKTPNLRTPIIDLYDEGSELVQVVKDHLMGSI